MPPCLSCLMEKDPAEENTGQIEKIQKRACLEIGQTKRSIFTHYKEQLSHLKYENFSRSASAKHAADNSHTLNINCFKLLKQVIDPKKVNAWESLLITKNRKSLVNIDRANQ